MYSVHMCVYGGLTASHPLDHGLECPCVCGAINGSERGYICLCGIASEYQAGLAGEEVT